MRTLRFIVDGQIIRHDPNCDFSGLVPGSDGLIEAKFSFSPDWKNCIKVAAFFSPLGTEYPPQKLENDGTCIVPAEALDLRSFNVQVIGRTPKMKITTNKLTIKQNGGKT